MRLVFHYHPVADAAAVAATADWYGTIGFTEAWREGDETVALQAPDGAVQVMVSVTDQPAGLMFQVDDLTAWSSRYPEAHVAVERYDIPNGSVLGVASPDGGVVYVFDQPGARV